MSYDQLRTLSFRLASNQPHPKRTVEVLNFPENWKSELRNLIADVTGRPRDQINIPIYVLNQAMRALVPDLVFIEKKAAYAGEKPWLYSAVPIDQEALFLIVKAWLKVQFPKIPENRLRDLLNQFSLNDLQWKTTEFSFENGEELPNGTAEPESNAFILTPHFLASQLTQNNVNIQFGSEVLRFRRAPLSIGTTGAEVISWPPISYEQWYWSVVITFTVQTVPFQSFPVVNCDLSVRRWASLPLKFLPQNQETSIYLLTQVPWIERLHQSNSFQVASIQWQQLTRANSSNTQQNWGWNWGSNLAPLLNNLNRQHPFPNPEDIVQNPLSALNLNGNSTAALVYRNGIEPKHDVQGGFGPADRRLLAEKIQELIAPEWEFVEPLKRIQLNYTVPGNPFFPTATLKKNVEYSELKRQCCSAIVETIGNHLRVEIWHQQQRTVEAIINAVKDCLGIPESASFPYQFPNLDFTLDIHSEPLGKRGDELELDSKVQRITERRRRAVEERSQEIQNSVDSVSGITVAFVELDNEDKFKQYQDPKDAIRRGFAFANRLTQFITTEKKGLSHRASNGFLDLLRQLGVQANPPKVEFKTSQKPELIVIPEPLHYVGVWSPTSTDGSIQRVPVMVHMASNSTEIQATALGFENNQWLPYREALLKIARGEARGVSRPEQAMSFIQQILKGDVLPLGDTLLLCHAQNLRFSWKWLQNKNISQNEVSFGIENKQAISKSKGLRIVRIRDNQGYETPEWFAYEDNEQGWSKGVFRMGERVFASTSNKPKQFQAPVNLSKVSTATSKRGKNLEPSPNTYFWNPSLVEITVACIQPGDGIEPWAMLTHELRYLANHYDEALKLPLPLHLAKKMQDYVLLLDSDSAELIEE